MKREETQRAIEEAVRKDFSISAKSYTLIDDGIFKSPLLSGVDRSIIEGIVTEIIAVRVQTGVVLPWNHKSDPTTVTLYLVDKGFPLEIVRAVVAIYDDTQTQIQAELTELENTPEGKVLTRNRIWPIPLFGLALVGGRSPLD